jgi:hypothetical protein
MRKVDRPAGPPAPLLQRRLDAARLQGQRDLTREKVVITPG